MSPHYRNRNKAGVTTRSGRDNKNLSPKSTPKKLVKQKGVTKPYKHTRKSSRRFSIPQHDPSDMVSDDENAGVEESDAGSSDAEEGETLEPVEFAPSDALESEHVENTIEHSTIPIMSDHEEELQAGLNDDVPEAYVDEDGMITLGDFVFEALNNELPELDESGDEAMLQNVIAVEEARQAGLLTDYAYSYDRLRDDSDESSSDEEDDNRIEEEETVALINEFSNPEAEWDCLQLPSHKELKAKVAEEQAIFGDSEAAQTADESTDILDFSMDRMIDNNVDDEFDLASFAAFSDMPSTLSTPKVTAPVSPSSIFQFSTPFSTGLLTPSSLRRPTQDPDDTEDEAITERCVKPAQISLRERKKMLSTSKVHKHSRSKGSLPKMGKFKFTTKDTVIGPDQQGGLEIIHTAKRASTSNTPRGITPWNPLAAAIDLINPAPPSVASVVPTIVPESDNESFKENFQLNQTLGSLLVMNDS